MRKQRPRGSTTRQAIINAALSIADRDGVDRLTIRSVAALVNAPPMSLYTHFANKEQLLDLMYEELLRRMYAYEGHSTWQGELRALCDRVRRILTNHPRWAALLSRSTSPSALPLRENILKIMAMDGLVPADGLIAVYAAALSSMGLVLVEVALASPSGSPSIEERFEHLRHWVETQEGRGQVRTRAALSRHGRFDFERVFQFFVDTFIVGLETRREQRQ
jgi:AcrR family transcriptional regulator